MAYQKGEYGKIVVIDLAYDLSLATALTLTISRPDGSSIQKTTSDGLQVGGQDLVVDGVTYNANQYATYTTAAGDIDQAGDYSLQLSAQFGANQLLKSPIQLMVVGE